MPKKKQSVPYTESFRMEAVRRSEEKGASAKEVAKELGISVGQIYNWRCQFKKLSKKQKVDSQFTTLNGVDYSVEEREELRELKRKNAKLEEEVAFLKKATAYFAKQKK